MNPVETLAQAKPHEDRSPAVEVDSWLRNPVLLVKPKTLAQRLAEEPEWQGGEEEADNDLFDGCK
jgi:hypothetical protein